MKLLRGKRGRKHLRGVGVDMILTETLNLLANKCINLMRIHTAFFLVFNKKINGHKNVDLI